MPLDAFPATPASPAEPPLPAPFDSFPAAPAARVARVLHVINGEHYSGAERVQDLLAARLPESGFDVGLACIKPDRFPQHRQCRTAPLYRVPMRNRFDLSVARRLADVIRGEGYRLVHAHTPRSALVARLAAGWTGVPLVYHVHSPTARDTTRRWQNRLNDWIERFSLRRAAALITVSCSLARHMRMAGYAEDLISIVHNGVPAPDVLRNDQPPRNGWTVGTVALFRPRKGIEVLLDALAILRRAGLPVQLRAVGPFETAQYESELKQRAADSGLSDAVQWTGFTDQVAAQLARMDLFVLPSLFGEGLPMVVLEAMAAGVPVVGTRVEGVPEAIDDGATGLLAAPSDPADLARCMQSVVQGEIDWSLLRATALRRHAQEFSDQSMAAGVAKVYRRVLDES